MSQLTLPELNPLVHGLDRLTDETTTAGAALAREVKIDAATGKITVQPDVLSQAVAQAIPAPAAEPLLSATKDVVEGGAAVFDNPSADPGPAIPRTLDSKLVVPWVAISDEVHTGRGATPALRSALGLEGAATAADVAQLLGERFPDAPSWVLSGGAAELFLQDPVVGPYAMWAGREVTETAPTSRPSSAPPQPSYSFGDYYATAMGIIHGKWNGLGGHWWGWPFGWQVAISGPTAAMLSNMLLLAEGSEKFFKAVVEAVKAQGVSTGLKALSLTAGAAIALYAFALAMNIRAVNGSKGVRLQGNWPVVGGPGAFVWAIKG